MSFLKKKEGLDGFKNQQPPTCLQSEATHLYAIKNSYMSDDNKLFARKNVAYKVTGRDSEYMHIVDEMKKDHQFLLRDLHKWFIPINKEDVKKENKEIIWRL